MDKKEYYSKFIEENKDKLKHMFDESITYTFDEFTNYLKDNNIGCRLLPFVNNYMLTSEGEVYFNDGNKFIKVIPWTFNDHTLYVSLMKNKDEFRIYSLPVLVISNFIYYNSYNGYNICKSKVIAYYDGDYRNCSLNNLYFYKFN